MAVRSVLSVSKLNDFKDWLINHGFEICPTKGEYEVLRATKQDRKYPIIVYKRLANNRGKEIVHLTILDRDMPTVRTFLKGE